MPPKGDSPQGTVPALFWSQILNQTVEPKASFFFTAIYSVFKIFASVRLAIPLLTLLIIFLAAGTIIESRHGTDAARILIYDSKALGLVLVLIAINLAAAAFDRLPWQKKHIGFVITHLGIISILVGSLMTQKMMIDGQMVLAEGETEHRIMLPEPILYIYSEDTGQGWMTPLKKTAFAWEGEKLLAHDEKSPLPFQMTLRAFYPKARMSETLEKAETGSAAIKVHLKSSVIDQELRLVEDDPMANKIPLGPAQIVFAKELLKENAAPVSEAGYLEAEKDGKIQAFPFSENMKLPSEFPLEGTPFKIRILKLFKNAAVSGKDLLEKPNEAQNPAVQFAVVGPDFTENHTSFSRFPDFPTLHGMKASDSGFHFLYRMAGSGSKGERHELRFVNTPEGLRAQIQTGMKVQTLAPETGKETPLGWMDLNFTVKEFFPHSSRRFNFSPEAPENQAEDLVSAMKLDVKSKDKAQTVWLGQGMKQDLEFDGKKYMFIFGEKKIPAGFKLQLKDFRVENYPGTEKPASFESDVILKDDTRGVVRNETISMNKPLVYQGYHIFQASYIKEEGQPEVSVFNVGRDPGVPVKYAGALIVIAGIVTMFFTRRPAKAAEGEL